MKKKSFSLIELIFAISLISILIVISIPKNNNSKLNNATNKLLLYLNYTRYIAFLDDKHDPNNPTWHKQNWTVKFKNCNKNIGGIYFNVFSDTNEGGRINKKETLKDPINNKYLYSNGCKKDTVGDKSKYVLLTQEFDIIDIKLSCHKGSGIGYISFDSNGNVYSKLGDNPKVITKPCIITMTNSKQDTSKVIIETTGYIYRLEL